jgi:aspartyl-tRNA(Asn)/glutamyl-tRNA(Gln) amidotransferase subunit C
MPAEFTPADLVRVAQLARLELTDDEQKLFAQQLADFLAYARQVQDVDTTEVPATSHPAGAACPMRDDAAAGSLSRETILAGAPDADLVNGFFKVPRVLG